MEFNRTYFANWVLSGYKYVLYVPDHEYAVLTPLFTDDLVTPHGYIIPIGDMQVIEIMNGIDEFKFEVL